MKTLNHSDLSHAYQRGYEQALSDTKQFRPRSYLSLLEAAETFSQVYIDEEVPHTTEDDGTLRKI